MHGNEKYGDIFDIETGKIINVQTTNAGTIRANYFPIVEVEFPIPDKLSIILDLVQPFDEYVKLLDVDEVKAMLRKYFPTEIMDSIEYLTNMPNK
jgi:hypothetical protein